MLHFWSYFRIFDNETVFIIGDGCSLSKANLKRLSSRNVISVNSSYSLGSWDYNFITGNIFYKENKDKLHKLNGNVITNATFSIDDYMVDTVYESNEFMTLKSGNICTRRSPEFGAINLAYQLGASNIVLIGFKNKKLIPEKVTNRFLNLCKDKSINIINCTDDSKTDIFPKMKLSTFFKKEKQQPVEYIGDLIE